MIVRYALSMGVIGKVRQVADRTLGEARFAAMLDDAETRPMRRAVQPRVARRPRGRGQQPDLIVAGIMASLFLWSSVQIVRQALAELRAAQALPLAAE